MKAKETITESFFIKFTGEVPINDDLERCNCKKAGEPGHKFCGWNYSKNKPMFMDNDEVVEHN
jgi:hypothetical protein